MLRSSSDSFETAALDLTYSSSLAHSKSNDLLLPPDHQFVHKRVTSNPFDILYSGERSKGSSDERLSSNQGYPNYHGYRGTHGTPKPFYNSNIYTPEHTLHRPGRVVSDVPPVITMIDQSALQRSTSVISRGASLRHRHGISKRNKMVNKRSLDVNSPSDTATTDSAISPKFRYKPSHFAHAPQTKDVPSGSSSSIYGTERPKPNTIKNRVKFLFQVQRKTSLKQKSAYKLLREMKKKHSKFQTKEELDQFLLQCNASKIMKELIPSRMKMFNYSGVLSLVGRRPALKNDTRFFSINGNNDFHVVSPHARSLSISRPINNSFKRQSKNSYGSRGRNHSEFSIVDSVYGRYRSKVFAGQHKIPPPFLEYFPEEAMALPGGSEPLISAAEIDNMNKKLLFEILLRRTLAAKIDYRLSQDRSRRPRRKKSSTESDSNSSSSSSNDGGDVRHSHIPKLIHTDSEDSPDDESIDTDDLMQQNASLFSGLLPSPQISYKSDIFGSDFKLDPGNSTSDVSSRMMKSRRTASTNDLLNLVRHVTPTAITPIESSFPNSPFNTTNFNVRRRPRDSFSARRDEELNVLERALGKPQFNYQLRPMARSIETFSSSEESGMLSRTPPVELSRNNSLKSFKSVKRAVSLPPITKDYSGTDKRDSTLTDTTNSFQEKNHRRSQSTSNTSIFQDLDDISSQLSSYIKDPAAHSDPPRFVHKNVVKMEEMYDPTGFGSHASLSDRGTVTGSHPNLTTSIMNKDQSANVSMAPSPMRDVATGHGPDIKSRQGSFSIAGSEISGRTSNDYRQSRVRRDDSMSTRTTFKRDYRH